MRLQGKVKIMESSQRKQVIQFQKSNLRTGKRNIALFHMSFCCGLRSKEMASLNIGDIYSMIDGKVFESAFLTREMTKGKNNERKS
jgi:site-specific recombinase XerD